MLISHRHRFIYTKTRKTASTSVESYFERFCMPDGDWELTHAREVYESNTGIIGYRGGKAGSGRYKWWNHMPALSIKELIGEEIWDSYFKFCVIRDPFEKCISAYDHFVLRANLLELPDSSEWVGDADMTEEQQRFLVYLKSSPPLDRDKYLIEGEFCLDDVIHYETLHDDIKRICDILSIPFEPDYLPTLKAGLRSSENTIDSLYTEFACAEVEEAFEYEIRKFGYSFPSG